MSPLRDATSWRRFFIATAPSVPFLPNTPWHLIPPRHQRYFPSCHDHAHPNGYEDPWTTPATIWATIQLGPRLCQRLHRLATVFVETNWSVPPRLQRDWPIHERHSNPWTVVRSNPVFDIVATTSRAMIRVALGGDRWVPRRVVENPATTIVAHPRQFPYT
eukprot:scaffold3597_cov202-Amphora_coffeaeformis.AAC.4